MRAIYSFLVIVMATFSPFVLYAATPPQWTWEAGKQTNNGAITIKSTNGSTTYSGTQNPTASAVKINQNVATQPPVVIIQGGGYNRWSMYYQDRAAGLP